MTQYRAQEDERWDIIVFKAYGNIEARTMDIVLDANEHLLDRTKMKAGDVVYLPEIVQETEASITKALW